MRVILTCIGVKTFHLYFVVRHNVYNANYVFAYTGVQSLVFRKVPYETKIKYMQGGHRI